MKSEVHVRANQPPSSLSSRNTVCGSVGPALAVVPSTDISRGTTQRAESDALSTLRSQPVQYSQLSLSLEVSVQGREEIKPQNKNIPYYKDLCYFKFSSYKYTSTFSKMFQVVAMIANHLYLAEE